MRKYLLVVVVAAFGVYMFGCGKKQAAEEQEPLSMEALSSANTSTPAPAVTPEAAKMPETKPQAMPTQAVPVKLESLPPAGPYKPTALEIQTALKNAGFYMGELDGRIGAMTKKAVEAFQKANNLVADGKIGPKTWAALSRYLNPSVAATSTKKKR